MQYTHNGRFVGLIHVQMPQQFIETALELNGLSLKNRDLVNQLLTEMMKLQRSGKKTVIHLIEVFPFGLSNVGQGEEMNIPGKRFRVLHAKKLKSSNRGQTEKFILGKETIRSTLPTPWKACPESRHGMTVWKHLQGQYP